MRMNMGRPRGLLSAVAVIGLGATLLAACAKSTPSSSGGSNTGGGSPTAMSNQVATQSVSSVGTVLTNSAGRTLYYLSSEKNGKIVCTGSCVSLWPVFVAPGGQAPTAGAGVTGKLGTLKRPDGTVQVTYMGRPLYTYSGDSSSGQANGEGIKLGSATWYAMTPSGQPPSSSGSGSSGGGGYGY